MKPGFEKLGRVLVWLVPPLWCLALYWRGLATWFQADDFAWLNLQVHGWNGLLKALFTPMAQGTVRVWSERLFFIGCKSLFGIHAAPFRIWVFLTQIVNLFLIGQIVRRLTGSRFAALVACVLWMSNAALTVVMGWNSTYNESLCAFFVLEAFFFLLRYLETTDARYNRLQWAAYLLGFGALEVIVAYPLLAASYTFLCARRHFRKTLLLFVPAVAFTAFHFLLIPKQTSGPYGLHFDRAMFATLATYWKWGVASRQFGDLAPHLAPLGEVVFTLFLAGFVLWRARRGDRLPIFCLSWFAIFLLPVLPLRDHVSDYYLTLPAIGLAMLMAYGWTLAWQQKFVWKLAGTTLVLCYLTIMLPVDRAASRWFYDRGKMAESILTGIKKARELHPGKAILLSGLTDELFTLTISPNSLGAISVDDVHLTPESRANIHSEPLLADYYAVPAGLALEELAKGRAVVYELRSGQLKDITVSYGGHAQCKTDANE